VILDVIVRDNDTIALALCTDDSENKLDTENKNDSVVVNDEVSAAVGVTLTDNIFESVTEGDAMEEEDIVSIDDNEKWELRVANRECVETALVEWDPELVIVLDVTGETVRVTIEDEVPFETVDDEEADIVEKAVPERLNIRDPES
jgi:hypothetical protein